MNQNIDIKLDGRGAKGILKLRPSNYVTTGGEASIYKVKSTIIKIYTDINKMIQDRMDDKIHLLASKFQHPYIIAPEGLVLNSSNKSIGYYMPFTEGEPYSRVFTVAFRQRNGFNDTDALILVEKMREIVDFVHKNGALLVDANELNWLMVHSNKVEPRVLDVDSWMIGNKWPATVIMPSIKDHHISGFSELTDWFSWGIVTFQLFTGIHPYKGRLDGYKPNEMEQRMKDNASVFRPNIHLNQNVRDFSCIPKPLLDWYRSIFEDNKRTLPPDSFTSPVLNAPVTRLLKVISKNTDSLAFDKLFDADNDPIVKIWPCGIGLRDSGYLTNLNTQQNIGKLGNVRGEIIRVDNGFLMLNEGLSYHHLNDQNRITKLDFTSVGTKFLRAANRIFIIDNGLCELSLLNFGKLILSRRKTWDVMLESTEWFEGLGVQNCLGAKFLILPFDDKACLTIRVAELDSLRIVSAKAGYRFVSLIGIALNGQYKKVEFTFDHSYKTYKSWIGYTDSPDMNSVILPNGITASIINDTELIIYVPTNGNMKKIQDKNLTTMMQLVTWGDKVCYIDDGNLWQIKSS